MPRNRYRGRIDAGAGRKAVQEGYETMNVDTAYRLAQIRRARGYSQEALANQLGVSRQAVSKWERAESSPDTDNLIALAELYGMSLDELIKGAVVADGAGESGREDGAAAGLRPAAFAASGSVGPLAGDAAAPTLASALAPALGSALVPTGPLAAEAVAPTPTASLAAEAAAPTPAGPSVAEAVAPNSTGPSAENPAAPSSAVGERKTAGASAGEDRQAQVASPAPDVFDGFPDGKRLVDLSWKRGINVRDTDGTRVHVGFDGIHVYDPTEDVRVDTDPDGGVIINGTRYASWRDVPRRDDERPAKRRTTWMRHVPFFAVALAAFFAVGFLSPWGWGAAACCLLTVPVWYLVVDLVELRDASRRRATVEGLWTVLVLAGFVAAGLVGGLWHPAWMALFLIPIGIPLIRLAFRRHLAGKGEPDRGSTADE